MPTSDQSEAAAPGVSPIPPPAGLYRRDLFPALLALLVPGLAPAQPLTPTQARSPAPSSPRLALAAQLQPIARDVWVLRGADGEANAANRGATSNLLVVADGPRRWLLGSGPSPRWGRALAAAVRQVTGAAPSDVIAPWPRPELVLGSAGMHGRGLRRWAHQAVDQAMRERCPHCIERLALRLGQAASDLEPRADLPALADHLLEGDQGQLGPWHWWLLWRTRTPGALQPVTLWHLPAANLWAAPGLLWQDGPPDLRDSRINDQLQALDAMTRIRAGVDEVAAAGAGTHGGAPSMPTGRTHRARAIPHHGGSKGPTGLNWWPEQGEAGGPDLIQRHHHYWQALAAAARQAWDSGGNETDAPPPLPGVAAAWLAHPRHALNWQRAWRETEAADSAKPPPAPQPTPPQG